MIPREAPEFAEAVRQQGVTVVVAPGRGKRRTLAEIVAALKARFGPSPEIQPEVTGAPQRDVRAMDLTTRFPGMPLNGGARRKSS